MGTGNYGGFGKTTGAKNNSNEGRNISLPMNDSQLIHIFSGKEGHYSNTKTNQKILLNLANNKKYYIGKDKYGNSWNIRYNSKGEQIWVRYKNNKINEGGKNNRPREWDNETGLNKNPFKNKRR